MLGDHALNILQTVNTSRGEQKHARHMMFHWCFAIFLKPDEFL